MSDEQGMKVPLWFAAAKAIEILRAAIHYADASLRKDIEAALAA